MSIDNSKLTFDQAHAESTTPVARNVEFVTAAQGGNIATQQRVSSTTRPSAAAKLKESALSRWLHGLECAAKEADSQEKLIAKLITFNAQRDSVHACFALERDQQGKLVPSAKFLAPGTSSIDATTIQQIQAAADDGSIGEPRLLQTAPGHKTILCLPTAQSATPLIAWLLNDQPTDKLHGELLIASLIKTLLERWQKEHEAAQVTSELATAATTLELIGRIENASGFQDACYRVASSLKELFKCDQAFVGWIHHGRGCRLQAVSDVANLDRNAKRARSLKASLDEAIVRDSVSAWPPLPGMSADRLLGHKKVAGRDSFAITIPLKNENGETLGAIGLRGPRMMAGSNQLPNFLSAIGEPIGMALATQQASDVLLVRWSRLILSRRHFINKLGIAALLLGIAATLCFPIPYQVRCGTIAEPVNRRFCVAPHDGLLENTFAQAGDLVDPGANLAMLDGRELRWELAGLEADYASASKQRDAHMAAHETPEALQAELEMQRLSSRMQLLRHREQNLAIEAPISGVVLSGSLDRRQNFPVSKGQVLYEIAPLNEIRIHVHIPAREISHTAVGQTVRLNFENAGTHEVEAKIEKIRPSSEVADDKNVFVAEVTIQNADGMLRPGIAGEARVITPARTIGWIYFHRAWEKLCLQMAVWRA